MVRKTQRSSKNGNETRFVVTLSVKNGPFATKSDAEQTRSALILKGITVTEISRVSAGYKFASKLSYGVPNAAVRSEVIKKLKEHAISSGIPKSAVSITTKRV